MKTDLHMHSHFSLDGEYSPKVLAELCKKNNLQTVALTDHNSTRGVAAFLEQAKALGLTALSGIEIDCTCQGVDLHLLGYDFDADARCFSELERDILNQKRLSSKKRIDIIHSLGIPFEDEKVLSLAKDGIVVGEMIAEAALLDEHGLSNPLLLPYRPGGSRADNPYVNFFWDYFSQGKPAYLPVEYPSFEEALAMITGNGGFAVVAHPVNTLQKREAVLAFLTKCGLKGLEVFSSYHKPADICYYRTLADKYGLLKTGGSDFHGKTKPEVGLGDAPGMTAEDEKILLSQIRMSS